MRNRAAYLLCALPALLTLTAGAARAQEHNSLAVGVSYTQRLAGDSLADPHDNVGLTFRWGHGDTGWGWQYGLGWFSTDLERSIGGRVTPFGELKIRPFVVGYGYTRAFSERVSVTAKVVGGPAWTSFELAPEANDAFHALAAQTISVKTGWVTPVVRPDVSLWYDINRMFGVSFGASYVIARPKVIVSSSLGQESSRVRSDAFSLSAGIVYRLF